MVEHCVSVTLYALRQFYLGTPIFKAAGTTYRNVFTYFSSPPHFIFFLLSNILLIIWQLLVAIFYIYNVIHPPPPWKEEKELGGKNHIRIYYQLRQRRHHQTYFNHNLQFHLSFGKLIFKIWQRQKQIYINYVTSTFCKLSITET